MSLPVSGLLVSISNKHNECSVITVVDMIHWVNFRYLYFHKFQAYILQSTQ